MRKKDVFLMSCILLCFGMLFLVWSIGDRGNHSKHEDPKVLFRTNETKIQMLQDKTWTDFEIKGINIGNGYPAAFPNDFAISEKTYYNWFRMIAEMNANTVRVYKVQSPDFYQALSKYNQKHDKKFYLLQTLKFDETKQFTDENLLDAINSNIIVSGAFAMFDTAILRGVGGYNVSTIGEDMELSMRIHAFCSSQNRAYRIVYAPEARCVTEFPFTIRDFYRQRRRWYIGMLQSMKAHAYMIGNRNYGLVGIITGTFFLFYELLTPFLEILGILLLLLAFTLNIVSLRFDVTYTALYLIIVLLLQFVLLKAISVYEVEPLSRKEEIKIALSSILETVLFHPYQVGLKICATINFRKHKRTWEHLQRIDES